MSPEKQSEMYPDVDPLFAEKITIWGRTIPIKTEYRPVDGLKLDPDNPRMRHETYVQGKTLTEPELEAEIWRENQTKKLFKNVLATKGFQNPLFITEEGRVVEGNRRTVVAGRIKENYEKKTLEISDTSFVSDIFNKVPCKVLPPDITQAEIDVLLAREHISGKDPWPPVNQAEHIHRLHHERGFPAETVAEMLDKSKPWVYQKLRAFQWTKEFLQLYEDRAKLSDYSYFEELYKKRAALRDIADFDVEDDASMEYFHKLVLSKKLKGAMNVRKLPAILAHQNAKQILNKQGFDQAWIVVMTEDPALDSRTFAAMDKALKELRGIPLNEYLEIPGNKAKKRLVLELKHELDRLVKDLDIK